MIKIALFDLDGVIIKDPIFSTTYSREFGITPEDMVPFFSNEFQKCLVGEADLKEVVTPYLTNWKWGRTVNDFVEYWMNHHKDMDELVLSLVGGLRTHHIKVALQTNQEKYRAEYIWEKLGLNQYFDNMFVSCRLNARKPQTSFFQRMLASLHPVEANEILFIDDSMNNISVAQNFGLKTHYYTNYENLKAYINYIYETQNS